ncbi:prolipoprotein diacylglyceryl transferase [Microscilla marina]|uniref:Phosphatidylglycerol--prolipoprotein diacylglyceryl transferase n=1 Tax=Microscilla marina ATCC 23134 TaxID=313606 RepID=A1ZRL4_MICM2|nr:prolipoprotein diacylglyceryl transferase [Microscilla marina]EAY26919.1 prolipoprotein diacylglyceryl transferase [Microscilla marina ATCC 23134]
MLSYINWATSPEIFSIGPLTIRWYGLLFASGFLIGQQIIAKIFKIEGKPEADLEKLLIYMVVCTVVGARLGHVLFYDPSQYFSASDPLAIFRIWEGGLASHGAAIAIPVGLYLYSRKREGQSFLWVVDRIVIVVALGAAFIRTGNLMNSEIIGKPTTASYGVVFSGTYKNGLADQKFYQREIEDINVDLMGRDTTVNKTPHTSVKVNITFKRRAIDTSAARQYAQKTLMTMNRYSTAAHFKKLNPPVINVAIKDKKVVASVNGLYAVPRHAAQFYEAISSLFLFCLLLLVYSRYKSQTPEGLLFGLFMVILFTLRIVYEFVKPVQSELVGMGDFFNMGQWLSVPGVVVGLVLLGIAAKNAKKIKQTDG